MCSKLHKDPKSYVILKLSTLATSEACTGISSCAWNVKLTKFYSLSSKGEGTFLSDELKRVGHVRITAVLYTLKNVGYCRNLKCTRHCFRSTILNVWCLILTRKFAYAKQASSYAPHLQIMLNWQCMKTEIWKYNVRLH